MFKMSVNEQDLLNVCYGMEQSAIINSAIDEWCMSLQAFCG